VIQGYIGRLRDLLKVRTHDVIVIEKELLPYAPAVFERLLSRLEPPYIVDYDDAVFHNYDLSDNPIVQRLLGRKIDVVMREADAVVAGNEYLATRARKADASKVEIIPTVIDLGRYPQVPPGDNGPFTIGWIGSPNTIRLVEPIVDALREACKVIDAKVVLVGSGPVGFDDLSVEVVEWSEETEIDSIARFDVGIMPLQDTPWQRGKCGLKLIQYMGCAKPVVASPVGMNTSIVTDGVNGYLASTHDEWVTMLKRIEEDRELARQIGANGRERVEDKYCLSATVPSWCNLIEQIAK
jgi:glycosyltransferase involved in cell wall biosynthesis